jgi:hypothetical protein
VNTGEARVRAALATIDSELTKLGKKSGERADAARVSLEEQRTCMTAALDAWLSISVDLEGDAFTEIADRVETARTRYQAAEYAYRTCDERDRIIALRDASDMLRVARNAALKEKEAQLATARLPSLRTSNTFRKRRSSGASRRLRRA